MSLNGEDPTVLLPSDTCVGFSVHPPPPSQDKNKDIGERGGYESQSKGCPPLCWNHEGIYM